MEEKIRNAYEQDFDLGAYLITDKGLLVIKSTKKIKDGEKPHSFYYYEDIKNIQILVPKLAFDSQLDYQFDIYEDTKIVFLLNSATTFNIALQMLDENFQSRDSELNCAIFQDFYKKLYQKWQSYIDAL